MQSIRSFCRSLFSSILIFLSLSAVAQGPFEFNGDTSDWSVTNSSITAGDYSLDYNLSTGSVNNNRLNYEGGIDSSSANPILAITLMNSTENTKLVFGLSNGAVGASGGQKYYEYCVAAIQFFHHLL